MDEENRFLTGFMSTEQFTMYVNGKNQKRSLMPLPLTPGAIPMGMAILRPVNLFLV